MVSSRVRWWTWAPNHHIWQGVVVHLLQRLTCSIFSVTSHFQLSWIMLLSTASFSLDFCLVYHLFITLAHHSLLDISKIYMFEDRCLRSCWPRFKIIKDKSLRLCWPPKRITSLFGYVGLLHVARLLSGSLACLLAYLNYRLHYEII